MRIAKIVLPVMLLIATAPGPAHAQCSIAAYGDPSGTQSLLAVYTEPGVPSRSTS